MIIFNNKTCKNLQILLNKKVIKSLLNRRYVPPGSLKFGGLVRSESDIFHVRGTQGNLVLEIVNIRFDKRHFRHLPLRFIISLGVSHNKNSVSKILGIGRWKLQEKYISWFHLALML